jgi:ribosomal protein S18 acetylase RimI-like enzyme
MVSPSLLRTAPPARLYTDSDLPALLALMACIAPFGTVPTAIDFVAAFSAPEEKRDPHCDIFVKPGPGDRIDGFLALYREDEFFTALGPFLAPDLSVRHRPCAHALLKAAETEATRRGWRTLRFEVDGADHERRILLHNRGYREVRVYSRMELWLDGEDWTLLADADLLRPDPSAAGRVVGLDLHSREKGVFAPAVLGELLDATLGDTWMYQPHGVRGAAERLARPTAGAERVLLGIDRESACPVGYFEWSLQTPRDASLDDIGVLRSYRRQGWGRRLMREGLAAMRAEGARRALLDVDRRNVAARWLYRRLGFVESGTVRYVALRLR